jgi:hypothetical protein
LLSILYDAKITFQNAHDAIAFAIHCGMIAGGLAPEGKVVCPPEWNANDGFYQFRYEHKDQPAVILKLVSMEQNLMIHSSKETKGSPVHTTEVPVDDYFDITVADLKQQFKDVAGLAVLIDEKVFSPVAPPQPKPSISTSIQEPRPGRYPHMPQGPGFIADPRFPAPPSFDPFSIGSGDLNPFGGGGGGMLVGPGNFPGVRGGGRGGGFAPRFDPFGPDFGASGGFGPDFGPNGMGSMGPDFDHLPPPRRSGPRTGLAGFPGHDTLPRGGTGLFIEPQSHGRPGLAGYFGHDTLPRGGTDLLIAPRSKVPDARPQQNNSVRSIIDSKSESRTTPVVHPVVHPVVQPPLPDPTYRPMDLSKTSPTSWKKQDDFF